MMRPGGLREELTSSRLTVGNRRDTNGSTGDEMSPFSSPRPSSNGNSPRSVSGRPSSGRRRMARPRRPSIHTFNQNLVAVLNDPTRAREPDLFTRDWGDAFVPAERPQHGLASRRGDRASSSAESGSPKPRGDATHRGDASPPRSQPASVVVPPVFFREDFDLSKKATFEEVLQPEGIDVEAAEGTHQELSYYLDTVELELSLAISDRSDRFFAALSSQQALNTEVLSVLDNIQVMRCHLANTQRDTSDVHLEFLSRLMHRKRGYELFEKLSSLAAVRQTQSTIQLLLATSDFVGALDLIGTTQEILRTDLKGIHCLKHLGSQLAEMKKVVERMMQDELIASLIDDLAQLKERHRLTAATTLKALVSDHLVNAEIDISDSKDERLRALVSGVMRQQNVSFTEPYNKAAINHLQVSIKQQYVTWLPKASPDEVTAQLPPGARSEAGFKLRLRDLPYDDWVQLMMSMSRMMLLTLIHLKENHGRITNALLSHCRDVEASLDLGADNVGADDASVSAPLLNPRPCRAGSPAMAASGTPQRLTANRKELDGGAELVGMEDFEPEMVGVHVPLEATDALAVLDGKRPEAPTAEVASPRRPAAAPAVNPMAKLRRQCNEISSKSLQVVQESCEEMHSKFSKLVLERKKNGTDANISASHFSIEHKIVAEFVDLTVQVARRPCTTLKATMFSQARRFLDRFHAKQMEKLAALLASETWKKEVVPFECQEIVNWIMDSSAPATQVPSGAPASNSRTFDLNIGPHSVKTVQSFLMYLRMVKEYLQCSMNMPALSQVVLELLTESLRKFNARVRKLVLEGDAQQYGLKRITAGNLALASQSVQAMIWLIGFIRARFLAALPANFHRFCQDLDKVVDDLNTHRSAIFAKLASLLHEIWDSQQLNMNWVKMSTTQGAKQVAINCGKIHKVLKVLLNPRDIRQIFKMILAVFNDRLMLAARQRASNAKAVAVGMSADVLHLEEVLGRLDNVPIELMRVGLVDHGLVLPPLVTGIPTAT